MDGERHVHVPARIQVVEIGAVSIALGKDKMIGVYFAYSSRKVNIGIADSPLLCLCTHHRFVDQIPPAYPLVRGIARSNPSPDIARDSLVRGIEEEGARISLPPRGAMHVWNGVESSCGTPTEKIIEVDKAVISGLSSGLIIEHPEIKRDPHRVKTNGLDANDVCLANVIGAPRCIEGRHVRISAKNILEAAGPCVLFKWRAGHVSFIEKPVSQIDSTEQDHVVIAIDDTCPAGVEISRCLH